MSKLLSVFSSRKFWAAIVGLVVLFLAPSFPQFADVDPGEVVTPIAQLFGVVAIAASYILGTALDTWKLTPDEEKRNKIIQLLTSRKFWAALVGLGLITLKPFAPDFPLTDDQIVTPVMEVIGMVSVLASYVMGTAIEDARRN